MPALVDWVETLRDVWSGFVVEVVLDPEAREKRSVQAELLRHVIAGVQAGYIMRTIVVPSEPGIDPAEFTAEAWQGILKRFGDGQIRDLMVLGNWPGEADDFFIASLLWGEAGLFRIEASMRYLREVDKWTGSVDTLLETVRLAWATCGGLSGWANVAVAGEPEQADEMEQLVAKWRRKSAVTLIDLTPVSNEPAPIQAIVRDACWLTLLSPGDVSAVGGLEALDAQLPEDIRLEIFEDGGVLIQLTPTPAPPEDPKVEEKYAALRRLIAPLIGR